MAKDDLKQGKRPGRSTIHNADPANLVPGAGLAALRHRTQAELKAVDIDDFTPREVMESLFVEASKAAILMYRRFNRGRKDDKDMAYFRSLKEASGEARQLADRLYAILEREGAAAEAENFFAELQERLAAIEASMGEGPHPLAAIPA